MDGRGSKLDKINQDIDYSICWNNDYCVGEMNRFYDKSGKLPETTKHFDAFKALLKATDINSGDILDLGCGTGLLSEYCDGLNYYGADLPHIISGCSMRNYPQYFYRKCDIIKDELTFMNRHEIVVINAVLDIMPFPLWVLEKILSACSGYLIIHRQEITESGITKTVRRGSYGGETFHSIINRTDFNNVLKICEATIIKEEKLNFGNWENGGSSFLISKKKSWSLHNMDHVLYEKYFKGVKDGFFIEAGANDGIKQSVSMFFEYYHNWNGMLIEPDPVYAAMCSAKRSANTQVHENALGGSESESIIDFYRHLASEGLMSHTTKRAHKINERVEKINVPVLTLDMILEQNKDCFDKINLFVLDTEGGELSILQGSNLDKWNIEYILVEEKTETGISEYLSKWYDRIDKLSDHDYLYKRR